MNARVLIVDDDTAMRYTLRSMIEDTATPPWSACRAAAGSTW